MSQIDDFLSGKLTPQAPSSIDDFLGIKPKKRRGAGDVVEDLAKGFGGAAVSAVGAVPTAVGRAVQEGGEMLFGLSMDEARRLAEAEGTPEKALEWYEKANRFNPVSAAGRAIESGGRWISEQGDSLRNARSDEAKELARQSTPDGDITKPSTWTMGENPSVEGVAQVAADVMGSMAPPVATAIATRGRSAATQMRAGGATVAGQIGGAAMDEASQYLGQFDDNQLRQVSPVFRDLEAKGYSAADARTILEREAQNRAASYAAPVGFVGGQATGALLGKPGEKLAGKFAGMAPKAIVLGVLGATEEGLQEVSEGVATRAGINDAAGTDRSLTEGTFGEFVLGAKGGGATGAGKGVLEGLAQRGRPAPEPAITPETGNTPPAAAAPVAPAITSQSDPTARLAELELFAEQRDLTPTEQREAIDLLTALNEQDATQDGAITDEGTIPQAPEVEKAEAVGSDGAAAAGVPAEPAAPELEAPGVGPVPTEVRTPNADGTVSVSTWTQMPDGRLTRQVRTEPAGTVSQPAQPGVPGEGAGASRPTQVAPAPTNRTEYVAEVRRQLGDLQPGDVLENDLGDTWTVDTVMRNKAGEITGFLPREADPETGKREVLDLDGAGSILLPSPYLDADGNRKMSNPGKINRSRILPPLEDQPSVDLQNRDRGRAASVVQMSDIARNPDYMRLGPSRTPDSGAPMVFAVGDQINIEPQAFGRQDVAVMSDGQRVPFRYAVVDATQVNPSNFADGRQNPGFNSTMPGTLKALNNGRTAGVRAAHEMGTAGEYVSGMQADEAMHGIPADVIARVPNPMLVRVYSDADNTAGMAAKSQGQGLDLSPEEYARQDAPLYDTSVLGVYAGGDVNTAANRDFVRAVIGKLQAAGQPVGGMMTATGELSPTGMRRIQAGLMQAAYGDADLVAEMFGSIDTDIKAIGEALKTVAGQWANMRDSAKVGAINPQMDVTQNLLQAIGLIRKARRDNMMVYDLLRQPDLMTGEPPSATTENVLRMFYSGQYLTRAVGKDKLIQALTDYITGAMATSPDAGLFGEMVTAEQILATIDTVTEGQADAETQPQEARGQPADGGRAGVGDDQAQQADGRQGAGEGGAGVVADRQGQPGQDADAAPGQQAGTGDQAAEESDGAPAGRADAGQQEDTGQQAAPARGRARKAKSEAVKPADGTSRAVAGGQEGINGYFYKGGQFLPNTQAAPGKWKVKGKWVQSSRALVAPGEFAFQPTPFSRSLFELAAVGAHTVLRDGKLVLNPGADGRGVRAANGSPVTLDMEIRPGVKGVLGKESLTLGEIVDAWNSGQRWFDVQPDAETITTKPAPESAPTTAEPEVKTLPSAGTFKSWSTAVPKLGTVNGWTLFRDSLDGVRYVLMTSFNSVGFDTEQAARDWAAKNKATKGDFNNAKSEGVKAKTASEQSAIDREKLDKDFRTFPTLILNNLLERGEVAKLYKAAGTKGASAFEGLAMDDKAAAYVKFVEQGGKPVENLPKDYNAWVRSQERDIEVRRLQSDRVVRQENGKPFKTKTSAQQFQERYDLTGTHEVKEVEGGFELRQLSMAAQAELKRKAEGRESYTEAQAAVAAEMGIGENADGELDATDAQFEEMERRVQARLRGEPAAPILTAPKMETEEAAKYLKDFVYSLDQLDGVTDRVQVALSSPLGKSGRDNLLMEAFGLTREQAHDINNRLDARQPKKLRNVDMQEAFDVFPGLRKMVDDAIQAEKDREARRNQAPILTAPTAEEVVARQEAAEAAQREQEAADRKAEADKKQTQARKEIEQASQAAADAFVLGEDPMANLTGQRDIFSAPADPDAPMMSRTKAKELRNLVTLHNLTEANLEYADSMGAIPVPSLGITKVDAPFSGFGNITLVGDKNLVDPGQGVPVFDRDAWTARFPSMNFKKPKRAKADAFYERMKAMTKGIGVDEGNFLSNLWESMVNASVTSPDKVAGHFQSYDAPRLAYARDVLERPIKVPMRAASRNFDFSADAKLLAYWKKNGDALNRMYREMSGPDFYALPQFREFSEEVKAAINRAWSDSERNEKSLANLRGMYLESMFDKDGVLYPADFRKMGADFEKIGVKEVDRMKLLDALDKVVKSTDSAYLKWVENQVKPLFDAPTITLRGKEVEPTLDNIVETMTVGAVQGVEKSMTFGPGKLAAHLGKRFKSLDEIKAARDQVVSESAENEAKKATDALLEEFRTHVSQFFTFKDWRGQVDTWAANDSSMEALATAGKQGMTDANIRSALSRKDFKGVDQRSIDLARQAIEALRNTATNYFEAKPQRAVKLNEFKGAVVPKDIAAESLAILEKNGITVELYGKAEGAREKAIEKLAKRLDRQSGDVLFSKQGRPGTMTESTVRQVADTIAARWTQAPTVVVVPNMQDMRVPESARAEDARQRAGGATGVPRGFYHRGTVYLVADGLKSVSDAAEALFHEALGHYGLRAVFGTALNDILDQIAMARPDLMRKKAEEYGKDLTVLKQRREVAEEVLAELSQARPDIGFVKRAIAVIRTWLRENVPYFNSLKLTDAEIVNNYIIPARGFVERGAAPKQGNRQAVSMQRSRDGALRGVKDLADFLQRPAFGQQGLRSLKVPEQRVVLAAVADTIHDLQILDDVVQLVPVDVMNKLFGMKGAADRLLNNPSMLQNLAAIDRENSIPLSVDAATAFVRATAFVAAKRLTATIQGGLSDKGLPAVSAFKRDLAASVSADAGVAAKGKAALAELSRLSGERLAAASAGKIQDRHFVTPTSDGVLGTGDVGASSVPPILSGDAALSRSVSQTLTDAFRRWFGDSKVVDAEGKPLVVYHGTDANITEFKVSERGTYGGGIYLTPDTKGASDYAIYRGDKSPTVYPVYVSIKNPATGAEAARVASWKGEENARAELIARGYDGVIDMRSGEIVAFYPEQIKSAIGNNGNFDPANPDIRFSRSTLGNQPPQQPPGQQTAWQKLKAKALELTSPDAIDNILYELQDKNIDLKRLRDHIKELGGTINDLNDAYLGEELYHKRLAKRTQDFLSEELRPLLADLRARGLDLPTLERYLHARHAPEANQVLAERNPNAQMIDAGRTKAKQDVKALEVQLQRAQAQGTATKAIEQALEQAREELSRWTGVQAFKGTEAERLSLSGMSDQEAADFVANLKPGQKVHLDALAARVDAMNAKTLDTLEKYGLMDKAQLDGWRNLYQHYVPLHRDEAHPDAVSHPIGQGFSTKGDASKRRAGSNEKVTNILAHIAMQREAALTRGEKNRVAKKLYLMASQNPEPEVWEVDKPPMIKTVDKETGFVRTGVDPTYRNKPNVVMVRIGGRDHAVVFNERNPQALRMALSLKNQDIGDAGPAINTANDVATKLIRGTVDLGKLGTRWLAQVNTQYNPIFGIINFARDVQAAVLQLSTTPLAGQERAVAGYVLPAMKGIYSEVRARRKGQGRSAGNWAKLWEDMQDEGGTTGFRDLFADPNERMDALVKELNALDRGKAKEAFFAVVDWLSDYNEVMENAVRLSAYKVALDQGMTKARAASVAKNITVNFNRKGRTGGKIGAWYAFFNAAVQGTSRMVETLKGPAGKKIIYGGVALGAVNTLIGMAVMGGGDDEEDNWSKIPEFVRERSLIVPLSREDYVAIPMPLGYHVLPNMGRKLVEMAFNGDPDASIGGQVAETLRLVLDAFNPLGGSTNPVQMLTPTIADPAIALIQNRDWTGKTIYREDTSGLDPTPGFTRAKDSASTFSKALTEALNKATGGTDYQPGAINWTPDQIDYIIGQVTGGVGRELMKVEQTLTAPFTGDELPPNKIPLAGRLYGNTRGPASESEKFYENVIKLNGIEREIKGRARDGEDYETYMAEEPLADLVGLGNSAQNQISKLRQARREVQRLAQPGYQDEVESINAQIGEVMKTVNQEVRRVQQGAR